MSDESNPQDLAALSSKLGQLIRSNELKMAGKLLATARGHLHQLAQKETVYETLYEKVALLRNDLMEPGDEDFDQKQLLVQLMEEDKELGKIMTQYPSEHALLARTLIRATAAVVLVFAQDMEGDAPLDF